MEETTKEKKDFRLLCGNRILLNMPEQKQSEIYLAPKDKEEIDKEFLANFDKMEVFAVGDIVSNYSIGDKVLVDPANLQKAPIITIGKNKKLLISPFDIILIW